MPYAIVRRLPHGGAPGEHARGDDQMLAAIGPRPKIGWRDLDVDESLWEIPPFSVIVLFALPDSAPAIVSQFVNVGRVIDAAVLDAG